MASTARRTKTHPLRVPHGEAQRVRARLLSSDVDTLNTRDITTLIKILDDVYPPQAKTSGSFSWPPLLIGIGVGLVLLVGIALFW